MAHLVQCDRPHEEHEEQDDPQDEHQAPSASRKIFATVCLPGPHHGQAATGNPCANLPAARRPLDPRPCLMDLVRAQWD
ncbi:hypothetical protein GCM10027589_50470 [Actinocorallia lasiicapitis]